MRKIGSNFLLYDGITPEECIKEMVNVGFEAVFTGMPDEEKVVEYANLFAKYNVSYETIHAPFAGINEIWLDTEAGMHIYQEMLTCIERCELGNVPTMIIHMSSGVTPPPVTDIGRERYDNIIEFAQKKGITLAFENLRKLSHLAWVFEHYKEHEKVFWNLLEIYNRLPADKTAKRQFLRQRLVKETAAQMKYYCYLEHGKGPHNELKSFGSRLKQEAPEILEASILYSRFVKLMVKSNYLAYHFAGLLL